MVCNCFNALYLVSILYWTSLVKSSEITFFGNNATYVNKSDNKLFKNRFDSVCGRVALKCFKPVLNYVDETGEMCLWKRKDNLFVFGNSLYRL